MSPREPAGPLCAGSVRQAACFWPGLLQRRGQPVLRVFDLDHANRSQFTLGHHLASLSHQRIAGVVVRHGKEQTGAAHDPGQFAERLQE